MTMLHNLIAFLFLGLVFLLDTSDILSTMAMFYILFCIVTQVPLAIWLWP
jgi:hypothetical protein